MPNQLRHPTPYGLHYREGGNPPTAAGIFTDAGDRVAWWPAGVPVTEAGLEEVVTKLVWKREDEDQPVSREAILALLARPFEAGGVTDPAKAIPGLHSTNAAQVNAHFQKLGT